MALYYRAAKPSRQEGILQASFVKVTALRKRGSNQCIALFCFTHVLPVSFDSVLLKLLSCIRGPLQLAHIAAAALDLIVGTLPIYWKCCQLFCLRTNPRFHLRIWQT